MLLDRRDDGRIERSLVGGGAERAVAHVASGAPGDLADLGRRQPARPPPVELGDPGKGDMVEIHVEPHADRIGGDEIIDFARLEHADLGIARPRAQRAEHDRRAAALPADEFGERKHIGDGKSDDGAARRQARHLFVAGMRQRRKARPVDVFDLRHEAPHQRLDRLGAEKHRLAEAAGVKQPRGKHMAALAIGAELDLVDGKELDRPVERHRFNGADEIRRVRGQDLFLPGNQRDRARPAQSDHAVIIFPRQETERKADHAAVVIEHALDREMRLAGIGRPEDRDEARCGTEHHHAG